jgi:hypothetical protein
VLGPDLGQVLVLVLGLDLGQVLEQVPVNPNYQFH